MFDVIIVAYNKKISNSDSIKSLLDQETVSRIIICDNSTLQTVLEENNQYASEHKKIHYVPMNGNVGLPRAYNTAIQFASSKYICIFDDDTPIPEDFFTKVSKHIQQDPVDVYVPIVYGKSSIISPKVQRDIRSYDVSTLDEAVSIPQNEITAINSGMVVKKDVYSVIHYDERLKVDMVDFSFMDRVREYQKTVYVMSDVILRQNLSNEEFNRHKDRVRLRIQSKDVRYYYSKNFLTKVYGYYFLLTRGYISYFIKYTMGKRTWEWIRSKHRDIRGR